jgi:hypothetical protein
MTATKKFYKYKCLIKCDSCLHGNACSADTGPSSLWQPTPSSLCRCHSPPFVTRAHKWLPSYVTLRRGGGRWYSGELGEYVCFSVRKSIRAVARVKFWIHRRNDLTMLSSSHSNPIHARYFPTSVFMSYHTLTSPSPPRYLTNWNILKWIISSWWNIFTEVFITIQLVKDSPPLTNHRSLMPCSTLDSHWNLSCANLIQYLTSHIISLRFTLILSSPSTPKFFKSCTFLRFSGQNVKALFTCRCYFIFLDWFTIMLFCKI